MVSDPYVVDIPEIRVQDTSGHPSFLGKHVNKMPVDLVKTFKNVDGAACHMYAREVVEFDLQGSLKPGICSSFLGDSGIQPRVVPGLDP